ncbi:hypothetical protein JCGZ_24847 [Jatropha curcas]|uniref:Uncharacterized protein n=1 Tax=Jatropha curcas TaxID=180498 RepID=A0A067L0U8_JATCU|nr:hypothetical protein JCGZ_24847 [Jatropha curcas]
MGKSLIRSFPVFKLFKPQKPPRDEDGSCYGSKAHKARPSDDYEGPWTADPRINDKTSAFIARIQAIHILES